MRVVYDEIVKREGGRTSGTGKPIYRFDNQRGVLQVAMKPSHLEMLTANVEEDFETSISSGLDLTLSTTYYGEHVRFEGVRHIESIPGISEEDCLLSKLAESNIPGMFYYLPPDADLDKFRLI